MIKVGTALTEHAEQLERDRGIPREVVFNSLKEAMLAAYKRYAHLQDVEGFVCMLNERSGEIGLFQLVHVMDEIDPDLDAHQVILKDALRLKADAEVGEILEIDVTPDDFGRIAAQAAKQVITQRIREAEKNLVLKEFDERKHTVTTAMVQRLEGRNVVVSIGKSEAILPPREQIPGEYYRVGNKLRVFILDVRDNGRVPQIIVSQAHAALVKEIFELEVPEIEDNLVEIKHIAREAGYRTKVAVTSSDPDVDPQGACIGARGSRIQAIVSELKNEKIDIIRWSENASEFIVNALAPARIVSVDVFGNDTPPHALVVVPDDQLSLAIGREGQNVRLAAKLTGFKLDIKSYSQYQDMVQTEPEDLDPEDPDSEELQQNQEANQLEGHSQEAVEASQSINAQPNEDEDKLNDEPSLQEEVETKA
jgi:transcription termination/antitermination protein NusA